MALNNFGIDFGLQGSMCSQQAGGSTASFDPFDLSPTGAFATHRFDSNTTNKILRLRGATTGEVDIWDIQQGTSNYKTTAEGDWVDGSGDTWYVVKWYNQVDDTQFLYHSTAFNQPNFVFNQRNAWPILRHNSAFSYGRFQNSNITFGDMITNTTGVMLLTAKFYGTPPASGSPEGLDYMLIDSGNYLCLARGNLSSGGDSIVSYNWDGSADVQTAAVTAEEWGEFAWHHAGGNLYVWKDGVKSSGTSSGNTTNLTGTITMSFGFGNGEHKESTMLMIFNTALSDEEIGNLTSYCSAK